MTIRTYKTSHTMILIVFVHVLKFIYQYPTCKVKYAETVITYLYSHKTEVDTGT